MYFARYVEDKGSGGSFTKGRIYFVGEGYHHDAVKVDDLVAVDDAGAVVNLIGDEGEWEYFEQVYVVWLGTGPQMPDMVPGDVCAAFSAYRDKGKDRTIMLKVDGAGYRKAEYYAVLDSTCLCPGVYVQDKTTGVWTRVSRVDGCEWLTLEGSEGRHPPTDFRFFVNESGLCFEPLVTCSDATGEALTEGRRYKLKASTPEGFTIENDDGCEITYSPDRFSP